MARAGAPRGLMGPLLSVLGRLWRRATSTALHFQRHLLPLCEVNWRGTWGNREPWMVAAADLRVRVAQEDAAVLI